MATQQEDTLDVVAQAFRLSEHNYNDMGATLYAEFARSAVDDPEMLALARNGMAGARPSHLFSAVHYLLLGDRSDGLARYFATLTDSPLPPAGAYPELVRYCGEHRGDLEHLLRTRTVQTTYAERCASILVPMCEVAREAGEPLNLIELGCSAGVLLVFDKLAYNLNSQGVIGPADAPFVLEGELRNGPELFIPRIGTRTGIDLHTIDVRSEEEKRWLLALCFPELREEQQRLAKALDVVAATDITLLEGDGLMHLDAALAATPDPVCVYHSSCLFYWPKDARLALEKKLIEAGRTRNIWRIAVEPSGAYVDPRDAEGNEPQGVDKRTGEIAITRYRNGDFERQVVGRPNAGSGTIDWFS